MDDIDYLLLRHVDAARVASPDRQDPAYFRMNRILMVISSPLGDGFRGPEGRVGFLLRQAQVAFRNAMAAQLRRLEVTPSQYTLLSLVESFPGSSGAELAGAGMLAPQSANEALAALCARGLLSRTRRPEDRRVRVVFLTESGAEKIRAARAAVESLEDDLTTHLAPAQLDGVRDWLVDFAARAEERAAVADGSSNDGSVATELS